MASSTTSSIAAAKNAGEDQNAINAKEPSTDGLSASEKRRLAALKGWERKRDQEKSASSPKKTRITPSRSARSATKTATAAVAAAPKQPTSKSKVVKKSVASAQKKGWETRKKKMAAAAATASPAAASSSSTTTKTKSLTHSEAARLGWERIRKKKALEEAKAKAAAAAAAAASKKKSSTSKTKGLSRAEAAKLGWERIRAKKMQEDTVAESTAAKNAGGDEDVELFKARSNSSKKGWETRKKKMLGEVKVGVKVKDKLFAVRSKSSKKGWETRRKMTGTAANVEVEDTDEWQQRSKASKKGWETRRKFAADAKKSVTHSEAWGNAAKLGSDRKRKMEDMSGESPESSETSLKKTYTAAARSKAAKVAWQKAKEKKMLMASTATAPSGRAYYQQDSTIAAHTYTAERVEWEIRQKMTAAANADEDSSSEGESDVESSEEEDSSDGGVEENEGFEEKVEERPAADISRDEAANLLLAMFGNSAPEAPAAKLEDTSGTDTSQETSIAEALQELKGAKSEDAPLSVEIYGDEVNEGVMEDEPEEISMRGRKRKPTYKHMMQHDDEYTSSAKAPSVKSSSSKARASSAKSIPKSPTRSGVSRAASKPATVATKGKTSKQRSTTAKQGWQKRKSEVFKKSKLDPRENEQISAAIAAVNKTVQKAAGKEMALPRGVTVRPSGKWQAQLYYAGKSRYIGVFESREDACYAYEVARQILLSCKEPKDDEVETNINLARKAAFAGVH
mmetsp:Transcript_5080/g.7742  ORF Transcript_5080/g.7742 Transcript_5080/m.7742 type:complete len:738 (+) Transcript_5080:145-2358(+)|eukprot:CAMPEP_0201728130 /NCGR_PEP_ID=MMETSP0593-20130828/14816_1 /ASSEMBLY_ACC=CAM_ASM_000672 /TAXON_ID=267983 /ORGANISM="Skeletonema japonicum, Strain CCMP2506" /LENGTH=737 /DNA_ID=CAMNT_0048220147 /DNA_START=60 /DNA_END=2273 /DNA_ORIENTATION=-